MSRAHWKLTQSNAPSLSDQKASGALLTRESELLNDICQRRFLLWSCSPHWMDFEVHDSCTCEMDGTPLFANSDDGPHLGYVTAPTDGSLILHGFLKWDGCCQWWHEGEPWHFDGYDHAPDVRDIIRQVWEIGAQNIRKWDKKTAGYPRVAKL